MYNIPIAIGLDGPLDVGALQFALDALAERHETLRTRLVTSNGRPVQRIDPPRPIPIATVDLTSSVDLTSTAALTSTAGLPPGRQRPGSASSSTPSPCARSTWPTGH